MDLKEQQNIIDSVNHIGRIVKRYASCNIGLRAFGAKAVAMPNYLQLGNCLQFSTFLGTFGTIGGTIGAICGTVRKIRGTFWTILRQFVREDKFIVRSNITSNKLQDFETVSRGSRHRSNHTQKNIPSVVAGHQFLQFCYISPDNGLFPITM